LFKHVGLAELIAYFFKEHLHVHKARRVHVLFKLVGLAERRHISDTGSNHMLAILQPWCRAQPDLNLAQPDLNRDRPDLNLDRPNLNRPQPDPNRAQPDLLATHKSNSHTPHSCTATIPF
jgi:hypothetical protein